MTTDYQPYIQAFVRKEIRMERVGSLDAFLQFYIPNDSAMYLSYLDETLKKMRDKEKEFAYTTFHVNGVNLFAYCKLDSLHEVQTDLAGLLYAKKIFDDNDTIISLEKDYIASTSPSFHIVGAFMKNQLGKVENISVGDTIVNYEWNEANNHYEPCKCKVIGIFTKDDYDWLSLKRMHRTQVGYRLGKQFRMPQYLAQQIRSV